MYVLIYEVQQFKYKKGAHSPSFPTNNICEVILSALLWQHKLVSLPTRQPRMALYCLLGVSIGHFPCQKQI